MAHPQGEFVTVMNTARLPKTAARISTKSENLVEVRMFSFITVDQFDV